MNTSAERILLVESDPEITGVIAYQALQPLGYQMIIVDDANSAITRAAQSAPDLVIADLNLPGLSGKDLLVALNSQGLQVPVIGVAKAGWNLDQLKARAKDSVEKHGGLDPAAFGKLCGLLRYVGIIISIIPLFLGLIWAAFDPRKQGWHDKIAKTRVIKVAK